MENSIFAMCLLQLMRTREKLQFTKQANLHIIGVYSSRTSQRNYEHWTVNIHLKNFIIIIACHIFSPNIQRKVQTNDVVFIHDIRPGWWKVWIWLNGSNENYQSRIKISYDLWKGDLDNFSVQSQLHSSLINRVWLPMHIMPIHIQYLYVRYIQTKDGIHCHICFSLSFILCHI